MYERIKKLWVRATACCLISLITLPAHAALFNFDLTGATGGVLTTIDFATELGLAPGSDVNINGISWDFSVTTNDPMGIFAALFTFDAPGYAGDSFGVNRDESAMTITSAISFFDISDFPAFIPGGVMILRLDAFTYFPDGSGGFQQPDQLWAGELVLEVNSAVVPIPGAVILLLSALAGLGFRKKPSRSTAL